MKTEKHTSGFINIRYEKVSDEIARTQIRLCQIILGVYASITALSSECDEEMSQ